MNNKNRNKTFLGFSKNSYVWLETLIFAIISIYIWVESGSLAPNSTENNFFWPLLGPLLIALRYGFTKGFVCALVTTAGLASIMNASGMLSYYPLSIAVGTIMVAMIAGEFHDYWHNINQKHILDHQYMTQKLDSFTQNYHLLKVSHDQLEQRSAGQTVSLRASISELHKIAAKHPEHRLKYLGQPYLNLMADIGGIEVAGIYKVTNGKINQNAVASVGDSHRLERSDPMLNDMLKNQKLLSPAKLDANQAHQSRYQLCIPLVDTRGVLQAAIIAENAKFFMLTPANVALLSLVGNYAADLLSDEIITSILRPHQSDLFIAYLKRASYNKRYYGADSSVVVCIDSDGRHHHVLDNTISYRRGADVYWSCKTAQGNAALAVLLPLTTAYDAQQYIVRLQELLKDQLGEGAKDIDILGPFSMSTNRTEIRKLMDELGAYDEDMATSSDHSI